MKQLFYTGIVEDRLDPLKLGRVRVRIYGLHTDDKSLLPTEDLPWAIPVQNVTSAAISGIGISPTGILPGTTVFCIFADGDSLQMPIVLGTLAGFGQSPNNNQRGFSDPDGNFPTQDFLGKSEIPQRASVEIDSDLEQEISQDPDTIPSGQTETFESPLDSYNASYPFNQAIVTESGHSLEFDNSPENERVSLRHRTGTEIEMQPDGNRVSRVSNNNYELIAGDNYIVVKGTCSITVDGDTRILCNSDAEIVTEGNLACKVKGNMCSSVNGRTAIHSKGQLTLGSDQDIVLSASGAIYFNDRARGVPNDLCPQLDITAIDIAFQNDEPETDTENISQEKFDALATRSGTDYRGEAIGEADTTPPASTGRNEEIVSDCNIASSNDSTTLSGNWTIGDLSTGAVFPHKIRAQNGLSESQIICNLKYLTENVIIPLERKYGRKVLQINSAFRAGTSSSQHNKGEAVDIFFRGMTSQSEIDSIMKFIRDTIQFDQLIKERGNNFWIHISSTKRQSRKQVLTRVRPGDYRSGIIGIA